MKPTLPRILQGLQEGADDMERTGAHARAKKWTEAADVIRTLVEEVQAWRACEDHQMRGHSDPATMEYGRSLVHLFNRRRETDALGLLPKPTSTPSPIESPP